MFGRKAVLYQDDILSSEAGTKNPEVNQVILKRYAHAPAL